MNDRLVITDLHELSRDRLLDMAKAGEEIRDSYRLLRKANLNIVGECLKGQGKFYEMNHYPDGDVYDDESHAQYYYHNHRGIMGEHGHFHTFVRSKGMPENMTPVPYDGKVDWPTGEDGLSHLVAISMDAQGFPVGFFATNRWVTGEAWYTADDVITLLDQFVIDHAHPNLPVNRWISAMFRLFRPQVEALIHQRDRVVTAWSEAHPGIDTFEDRDLEVTGELLVSVDRQIQDVQKALG